MQNLMKKSLLLLSALMMVISAAHAQKAGLKQIDVPDLETHMKILASDEMEGRATGEEGLDRAADYLREQAGRIGLKAIDDDGDYFQDYTLVTKQMNREDSYIKISPEGEEPARMSYPFYVFSPDTDKLVISGEAAFAGYGIYSGEEYNDFDGLNLMGKVVLIMNRGPLDENGENLLEGQDWSGDRSFQYKMPGLVMRGPKAVLIVMDPKSGNNSLEEASPGMARYLSRSRYVKELGAGNRMMPAVQTKIMIIHRKVADEILNSCGRKLEEIQDSIDRSLTPLSFELPEIKIEINAAYDIREKMVPNVVGLVEGSDPELKKEVIVYTAHFDHLGTDGKGGVYNGADDNASGSVALIELGQAFKAEQKKLKRSVMLLWVSGEEIGLYGSRFYTENPLMPLEQTMVNINLDMIGTVRTERDNGKIYGEQASVLGMDSLGLIGGLQSAELLDIHYKTMAKVGLVTDEKFNDPDHPYRYYYRSDHINFARHNIPVLFYSTGTHVDYHKVSDDYSRINFEKLHKVNELVFLVGYKLARLPDRILVDKPFSDWGQMRR